MKNKTIAFMVLFIAYATAPILRSTPSSNGGWKFVACYMVAYEVYLRGATIMGGGDVNLLDYHDSDLCAFLFVPALLSRALVYDEGRKMCTIGAVGLTAWHAYRITHKNNLILERKKREVEKLMHPVNDFSAQNGNLREVKDDDRCVFCLENFKDLHDAQKTVMQAQCCGQIMCKDDLVKYLEHFSRRWDESDEPKIVCFACRNNSLDIREIESSHESSVMRIERRKN